MKGDFNCDLPPEVTFMKDYGNALYMSFVRIDNNKIHDLLETRGKASKIKKYTGR